MNTLETYLFGKDHIAYDQIPVYEAVSKLPEENKLVIELHFVSKIQRGQIAEQLGWSLSKVNQKITRGITLLKLELNPEYFRQADEIMQQNAQRLLRR